MGRRFITTVVIAAAMVVPLAVGAGAGPLHAQTGAHELVKKTTDEVIAELQERRAELEAQPGKIYDFVQEYLLPHFDFERMSRLVLGKHWRRIDEAGRERFIREFQRLLVRTYATSMFKYSDEKISFLPYHGEPGAGEVIVKTEVERPGGEPVPIDYRLYATGGEWKVYDVAVDGVSLVINYRSSFASQIARLGGVDALTEKLRERNKQVMDE